MCVCLLQSELIIILFSVYYFFSFFLLNPSLDYFWRTAMSTRKVSFQINTARVKKNTKGNCLVIWFCLVFFFYSFLLSRSIAILAKAHRRQREFLTILRIIVRETVFSRKKCRSCNFELINTGLLHRFRVLFFSEHF